MCEQNASPSGIAWFERRPNSAPLRVSTMRWMNCAAIEVREVEPRASGMWRSSRSSTERVASANER